MPLIGVATRSPALIIDPTPRSYGFGGCGETGNCRSGQTFMKVCERHDPAVTLTQDRIASLLHNYMKLHLNPTDIRVDGAAGSIASAAAQSHAQPGARTPFRIAKVTKGGPKATFALTGSHSEACNDAPCPSYSLSLDPPT